MRILWWFPVTLLLGCVSAPDPYAYERRDSAELEANPMTRAVMGLPAADASGPLTGPMGGEMETRVEHYMAQQEAELKKELVASGVKVKRVGDDLRLVMPGHITFDYDSVALQESFLPVLNAVAKVLARYDRTALTITGHTDSKGHVSYNKNLSEARAESVAAYLSDKGISRERIITEGKGETQPIASNKTEQGRAANRRVELDIKAQ